MIGCQDEFDVRTYLLIKVFQVSGGNTLLLQGIDKFWNDPSKFVLAGQGRWTFRVDFW